MRLLACWVPSGHPRTLPPPPRTTHPLCPLPRACAELPKLCEFFHIPFQSGDNDILRDMKRGACVRARVVTALRRALRRELHGHRHCLLRSPARTPALISALPTQPAPHAPAQATRTSGTARSSTPSAATCPTPACRATRLWASLERRRSSFSAPWRWWRRWALTASTQVVWGLCAAKGGRGGRWGACRPPAPGRCTSAQRLRARGSLP